ncbi:MAG: hypothetical protein WCW77_05535 [Patescibacteria group bacterium]|jgi:hypothetical protein
MMVFYILIPLFGLLKASFAQAICPVCTVTVVAAMGLSRWLGVDDTIAGVWIGGLTVSLIYWTMDWLDGKKWRFPYDRPAVIIGYYVLIYFSLYYSNFVHLSGNKLWGIDKLLLGILSGSLVFWGAAWLYHYLKRRNDGHAYFPFQKVVMPVSALLILSAIFYFITK